MEFFEIKNYTFFHKTESAVNISKETFVFFIKFIFKQSEHLLLINFYKYYIIVTIKYYFTV